MRPLAVFAALLGTVAAASAQPSALAPQVQADLGLSVVGVGYEHPLADHVSLQGELEVFGTYFLPWFDAGEDAKGLGFGIRPTWFQRTSGHGLYVAPYFRGVAVDEESLTGFGGIGFAAGVFVGWAFGLTEKLDLRIGGGAQYIHFHVDTPNGEERTSTPFVALDAVLGYRL
jgi:hypothetical protein